MLSLNMRSKFVKVSLRFCVRILKCLPFCIIIAVPRCPAKTVDLVHYPTTLAPSSVSKTVTVQCADNAHVRT